MKKSGRPLLSVVLATHNEAQTLPRCLQAVKQLADEIIVADGKSTDGTAKVARSLGARVISTTNKRNFHINKQLAMNAAHGRLVLQLDADETVDPDLARFILTLKQEVSADNYPRQISDPVAWWIKRKNYFLGTFLKKGGQYPDPVIRLYLAGKARLPQKDVHEQMQVSGVVGWAQGHLLHYSSPTFSDYLRKFNTYTSFAAHRLFEQSVNPSLGFYFRSFLFKPVSIFFSLYFRHRGFVDGVPGLVFALMSSLHPPFTALKLKELYEQKRRRLS